MTSVRRFTALAMARAMMAGPPRVDGLAARLQACLGRKAAWYRPLAERVALLPGEHWRAATPQALNRLADMVEADDSFEAAWLAHERPQVRHYFLELPGGMQPRPLGLDELELPDWPDVPALSRWLGIPAAGLWRLTLARERQRRQPLGQQHYRSQLLPKRSGGFRLLEVPEPYLMALQRKLLDAVLNRVPPHEAACGYTPGRSVLDHARAHAGQAVVLKFDLQDFFASVRHSRVHALFATLGYPAAVARALAALCTLATPEPVLRRLHQAGSLSWPQLQCLRDAHLPQGAPTSAALANLCAFRLDLRLDGLAFALGARYTRYADDLVISGGPELRGLAERVERWVGRIALEEGLALNHRKTRCQTAGRRQSVCSIVVNQRPNLPRDEFDRLKAVLHQCVQTGPAAQNREGHADWRGHLQGRVAWAAQLNPAKAERLQGLLAQIDWAR